MELLAFLLIWALAIFTDGLVEAVGLGAYIVIGAIVLAVTGRMVAWR